MWASHDFEERATLRPGEERTALTGPGNSALRAETNWKMKQSTVQTVRWHRCNPIGFSTQIEGRWFHGFLLEQPETPCRIAGTGGPAAAYHLRGGSRRVTTGNSGSSKAYDKFFRHARAGIPRHHGEQAAELSHHVRDRLGRGVAAGAGGSGRGVPQRAASSSWPRLATTW